MKSQRRAPLLAPRRRQRAPPRFPAMRPLRPWPPRSSLCQPAWPGLGKGCSRSSTSEDELVSCRRSVHRARPLRRVPVAPGEHEVSIRKEGSERRGTANVELRAHHARSLPREVDTRLPALCSNRPAPSADGALLGCRERPKPPEETGRRSRTHRPAGTGSATHRAPARTRE